MEVIPELGKRTNSINKYGEKVITVFDEEEKGESIILCKYETTYELVGSCHISQMFARTEVSRRNKPIDDIGEVIPLPNSFCGFAYPEKNGTCEFDGDHDNCKECLQESESAAYNR